MMRAVAGMAMVITCGGAFGQSAESLTTFEVASIRPSEPPPGSGMRVGGTGGPGTKDPTRIAYQNMTLSGLVSMAWDLKRYQYSGPSWMGTERFDITAKVPEGATRQQFRVMMQNLLAERFKLAVHHEQKEMPGFQLVVAKGGPKMQEAEEAPKDGGAEAGPPPGGPPKVALDKEGYPVLPPGRGPMMIMERGRARMRASGQTMEQFAVWLGNQLGKPITDATGLKGKYDLSFYWSSEGGTAMGPPGASTATADDDSEPNVYSALQEQLGLRLEAKKTSVDMVVVDKCEKVPTAN